MVVTCDVQFENNPEAAYYAGQVITGKVTLTADKIKQVKAVNLKINGSAKTKWLKKGSKNGNNKIYWGQMDYINTVTCLLTPKASDQTVIIEPGIHTFSFACHIPVNCPSSFEGDHGSIRYLIQVSLGCPWKYDQTFTKTFTVLEIMNLNYNSPLLKLPVKTDIVKTFCCGPLKSDPLQIHVQLPQAGYVPGQLIPVNILITNDTLASINEVWVRLVMVVKYFSTIPKNSTSETKTISQLIGDPVLRNCKKNFNYLLPIPATPPTCTTLCSIIKITYRVEVEAKMPLFYVNQCSHTAVTIGNVPLQTNGMVVQLQPKPKQSSLENGTQMRTENADETVKVQNNNDPTTSNENTEPWSAIENIAAPVYMEATHIPQGKLSEDNAHEYGETSFTPKYPVFNIPNLQPNSGDGTQGHGHISMVMDPNKTTWL